MHAHDYKDAYALQAYLPAKLEGQIFYVPTDRGYEKIIKQMLERWRSLKKAKAGTSERED